MPLLREIKVSIMSLGKWIFVGNWHNTQSLVGKAITFILMCMLWEQCEFCEMKEWNCNVRLFSAELKIHSKWNEKIFDVCFKSQKGIIMSKCVRRENFPFRAKCSQIFTSGKYDHSDNYSSTLMKFPHLWTVKLPNVNKHECNLIKYPFNGMKIWLIRKPAKFA